MTLSNPITSECRAHHAKTPIKLKMQIDVFLIERLHGRTPQRVALEHRGLTEILAEKYHGDDETS
jgi:hypothetical protein